MTDGSRFDTRRAGSAPASQRRHGRTSATAMALALLSIGGPALAEDTPPQTAQTAAQPAQAEEIVVTARRRSEPLQEVPISVSVVSGDYAAQHNLNDLQDITTAVPSADFRTSSSNKDRTLFIRGIGTIATSPGVEPSVSTVVDGVVLARSGQSTLDLVGLDHVEVLQGPQGTLFGKNASAGVVNISTKEPSDTFQGFADASYYSGNEYRVDTSLSGPILPGELDGLLTLVGAGYDGNVTNLFNGQKVNGYQHEGFRSKLLFTPNADLSITLAADYLHSEDTVPNGVWVASGAMTYPSTTVVPNPTLAAALAQEGIGPSADNRNVNNNTTSGTQDDNGGFAATVNYKLGDYNLTSVSAYRRWHNVQREEYDQLTGPPSSIPQAADLGILDFDQFSEEARLASPKGEFFDYVAGLYYMHAVDGENYNRTEYTAQGTNPRGSAYYGTTGNDYAVFAEGDINFTKEFRGILGARFVHDDLDYHMQRNAPVTGLGIGANFASAGSTLANDYTDRIGLQYDIADGVMTYFTYSHGYKGPAFNVFFNMSSVNTAPLKPETSDAYEIGLKANLYHHKLEANLSGFIDDFDNYQANFASIINGGLVTNLINAGTVSTKGVAADLTARPTDALTLNAGMAATIARVDHFACPPDAPVSCDIDGKPLPFAPDWKLNIRADYDIPLGNSYGLTVSSDYSWQSATQYQLSEVGDTIQPAYGIWNGGVTLANDADGWQVIGQVKNILDQHYLSYIVHGDVGGVVGWIPRDFSRYYGISFHKEF